MSLLHSDGFDSHATGTPTLTDGDTGWTGQSSVSITAMGGKFGGKSLQRAAGATGYARFTNAGTERAFAGYFKCAAFGGAATIDLLREQSTDPLVTLDNTGVIKVYDGSSTLRVTSAASAKTAGAYDWLEIDYLSTGIYLYVNGALATSYVGAYTAPNSTVELLGIGTSGPATDVDDFISWDKAGSFFNSTPLAPRRIQLLRPNGPSISGWVPAGPTNWESVDDTDWSGGAGVTATTVGQKDRYTFSDVTAAPGLIDAVVVRTRCQNTGSDPATLTHVSSVSGTEVSSAAQSVTAGLSTLTSVFYRDPSTVAWTATTVNSAEFGQVLGA